MYLPEVRMHGLRILCFFLLLFMARPGFAEESSLCAACSRMTVKDWSLCSDSDALAAAREYIRSTVDWEYVRSLATQKRDVVQFSEDELTGATADVVRCMRYLARGAGAELGAENSAQYVLGCIEIAHRDHYWMSNEHTPVSQEIVRKGAQAWDDSALLPLPYAIVGVSSFIDPGDRRFVSMTVSPVEKGPDGSITYPEDMANVTKEQLAATLIAAAKYYAPRTKAEEMLVMMEMQHGGGSSTRLGSLEYAPDGKGKFGRDKWTWNSPRVAGRGLSKAESAVQRFMVEVQKQGGKEMLAREMPVRQETARRLGLKVEDVFYAWLPKVAVPLSLVNRVAPARAVDERGWK